MARAPRQADIAAAAGVSQTTVSLVLSGSTEGVRLSEPTRQRVLRAAERLGYVPDPVATRLASSRNHMLGVYTFASAFPTDVDDFYYPILVGIEQEAEALGQDLVLFTGTGGLGADAAADHKAAIRRTRIADGCLFFGRHVPEEPIEWLLGGGFPLVYIGRREELGGRIPFVGVDYVSASSAVVSRVLELGHRKIRYLRSDDDAPASTDREKGVLAALRRERVPVRGVVVRAEEDEYAHLLERWLADGVTAVVLEEADTSTTFFAAVEKAGVSCPADLSVAVLGQPRDRPDVTGFEVPRHELGRRAVRMLMDQITGARRADQQLLDCRPVSGSTVGPR